MAFDEGNPAPPPAPVARLPRLPSNAEIVRPRNDLILVHRMTKQTPSGHRFLPLLLTMVTPGLLVAASGPSVATSGRSMMSWPLEQTLPSFRSPVRTLPSFRSPARTLPSFRPRARRTLPSFRPRRAFPTSFVGSSAHWLIGSSACQLV